MMQKWNDHHDLEGKHAFLGASQHSWIRWDKETLEQRFYSQYATTIGTAIHQLASDCIKSRTKLNLNDRHLIDITLYKAFVPRTAYDSKAIITNLVNFVNDCIACRMSSEVVLYYSPYCFGTTDAISFDPDNMILRIFDYKNGVVPVTSFDQPLIYSALACLEYKIDPYKLKEIDLRIYQSCDVNQYNPSPEEVKVMMDIIVAANKDIYEIKERG